MAAGADYPHDVTWEPFGEPRGIGELRAEFPEWVVTARGLAKVTARLEADPSAEATHGPVSVMVMRNMLKAWRVEQARPGPR